MVLQIPGRGALDYAPCRYGRSKLLFRGPCPDLSGRYIAFLGGTATYGKFVADPFPSLVAERLGVPGLNLGWINAGLDVFLQDNTVMSLAGDAEVTVVQIAGAQNMSNRFYSVHPRRNDRFLKASPVLRSLYRDVDFTNFHFTRHMLTCLREISEERFGVLREELRGAWVARMRLLLGRLDGRVVLLWFADHGPDMAGTDPHGADPLFVDREMLRAVRNDALALVEVVPGQAARDAGCEGMVFSPMEALAAAELPNPVSHAEAAEALCASLTGLLGDERSRTGAQR